MASSPELRVLIAEGSVAESETDPKTIDASVRTTQALRIDVSCLSEFEEIKIRDLQQERAALITGQPGQQTDERGREQAERIDRKAEELQLAAAGNEQHAHDFDHEGRGRSGDEHPQLIACRLLPRLDREQNQPAENGADHRDERQKGRPWLESNADQKRRRHLSSR